MGLSYTGCVMWSRRRAVHTVVDQSTGMTCDDTMDAVYCLMYTWMATRRVDASAAVRIKHAWFGNRSRRYEQRLDVFEHQRRGLGWQCPGQVPCTVQHGIEYCRVVIVGGQIHRIRAVLIKSGTFRFRSAISAVCMCSQLGRRSD